MIVIGNVVEERVVLVQNIVVQMDFVVEKIGVMMDVMERLEARSGIHVLENLILLQVIFV